MVKKEIILPPWETLVALYPPLSPVLKDVFEFWWW